MNRRLRAVIAAAVFTVSLIGAAPSVRAMENSAPQRINLHVGEDATDSVNITWITDVKTDAKVMIAQGNGKNYETYTGTSEEGEYYEDTGYKIPVVKFTNKVEVKGLKAGKSYNYVIGEGADAVRGTFRTASANGKAVTKFVYVSDPQVKTPDNGEAWAATADQISRINNLDFIYIAGDHTDKTAVSTQWDSFYHNNGAYPDAVQNLLLNNTLMSVYGNHDTKGSSLDDSINLPDEYGQGVYSVDYGTARFINLNMETAKNDEAVRDHQYEVTKELVNDAKAKGMWTIVNFHKSLYTGASHVDDEDVIAARTFWGPRFAQLDVDAVLQGHDHVYSRGFVNAEGYNANPEKDAAGNIILPDNAPLWMVGNHPGGLKWYSQVDYEVTEGDPISPDYEFLDVNSTDDGSDKKREQTWTVVEINNRFMKFTTYMMKYDEATDSIVTEPYIYDTFTVKR